MTDQLATYTYLPSLQRGLSTKITTKDTLGKNAENNPPANTVQILHRASVKVSLQVNDDAANPISQNVQLLGPGDVIGISPRAIVRTEPRNWTTDFEPNYLAFIEFYEEDFLCRFTPATAVQIHVAGNAGTGPQQTKLRPWIFLAVLEEEEYQDRPSGSGPLPVIQLTEGTKWEDILPPPDQSWAWAHVHVNKDITAAGANTFEQSLEELQSLLQSNPDHAVSRLMCPRKLKPSTAYHAFLIPAFEVGRLAGLGQETDKVDALSPSWGAGQVDYPVYYRWYFQTGQRGDFEFLVNLLQPREVDERVGVRDMDMQDPRFGVTGMRAQPGDLAVMGLEGALKSPQTQPKPAVWPPKKAKDYPAFLQDLQNMVNLQDALVHAQNPDGNPDPIISPPLYGRWHAMQTRLEVGHSGWVNELNEDPRLRVSAGIGAKAIQTGQEGYMQKAWQQLGEILHANQKIRQIQLSIATSMRVYDRHLVQLDAPQQISLTRQVHAQVMGSPTTIYQELRESRLEGAVLKPAFRRISRKRGPIMRKAFPKNDGTVTDILVRLNTGKITAAQPKKAPARQISLNNLKSAGLHEENLTATAVSKISSRPVFNVGRADLDHVGPVLTTETIGPLDQDSAEARLFRNTVLDLHTRLEISLPAPQMRPEANLDEVGKSILKGLNPKSTILQRARSMISIPSTFVYLRPTETIVPIMAHPVFSDPMYKPLRDISSELLIPNLSLIPNNSITLLETNSRFIEAYMVGLNHEMAHVLLWSEFDTDQRGSYFRQFWDIGEIVNRDPSKTPQMLEEELRDIRPLHEWSLDSALGSHANRDIPAGGDKDDSKLVLVVRGDLLKRYPTAIVSAQEAEWVDDKDDPAIPPRKIRVLKEKPEAIQLPIFKAQIEPDVYLLGFNLTKAQAKGDPKPETGKPGWFFVIQERPGEPRFGLDITNGEPAVEADKLDNWNQLSWNHLGDPNTVSMIKLDQAKIPAVTGSTATALDKSILWGSNAADMAYILFQVPVMVAIHADNMLA